MAQSNENEEKMLTNEIERTIDIDIYDINENLVNDLSENNTETVPSSEEKNHQKQEKKLGKIVLGLLTKKALPLIVALPLFVASGCSTNTGAQKPTSTNSVSASETDNNEQSAEQLVESLEISSELSGADLANAIEDRLFDWYTAGFSTDEQKEALLAEFYDGYSTDAYNEAIKNGDKYDGTAVTLAFCDMKSKELATAFEEALLKDDYQNSPINDRINFTIKLNSQYMYLFFSTDPENTQNKERWFTWNDVDEGSVVQTESNGVITLEYNQIQYSNGDKNTSNTKIAVNAKATVQLEKEGDTYKIVGYTSVNPDK